MSQLRKITFYRRTFYVALFAILLTNLLAILVFKNQEAKLGSALTHSFVEDFSSARFNDTAKTTGSWSTTTSQAQLNVRSSNWFGLTGGDVDKISINSNSQNPQIVKAADGQAMATWMEYDYSTYIWRIAFSRFDLVSNAWVTSTGTPGYEFVSSNIIPAGDSRIAVDVAGQPMITWMETPSYQLIAFTRFDATTSTWVTSTGTPGYEYISDINSYSWQPQLVADSNGQPMLTWYGYDSSWAQRTIFSRYDVNANAWVTSSGTPGYEYVSAPGVNSIYSRIAVNASGSPILCWLQADPTLGIQRVAFTSYDSVIGNWVTSSSTPGYEFVSGAIKNADSPQVAVDANGMPLLSWLEYDDIGYQRVAFTRLNAVDSTWVTALGEPGHEFISGSTTNAYNQKMSVNAEGRPNIIWEEYDANSSRQRIAFTSFNYDINSWIGSSGEIGYDYASSKFTNSSNSQITIGSDNQPIIIWMANGIEAVKLLSGEIYNKSETIFSLNINNRATGTPVVSAVINPTQELNGGTISYHLSNDGGSTWATTTAGVIVAFSTEGADLRWKAVLTTADYYQTPVITSVAIDYDVDDAVAPLVNSIKITEGSSKALVNLSLTFSDVDGAQGTTTGSVSGITSYQLSNDGQVWSEDIVVGQPYVNGTEIAYKDWDLSQYGGSAAAGNKTIYVRAKDNDGNLISEQSALTQTSDQDFNSGSAENTIIRDNSVRVNLPGLNRITSDQEVVEVGMDYDYSYSRTENITSLSNGNFAYLYFHENERNVYLQLYDSLGQKIGTKALIDHSDDWLFDSVALENSFLVLYHPDSDNQKMIAREYQNDGTYIREVTLFEGNYTSWRGYKAEKYNNGFKLAYFDSNQDGFIVKTFSGSLEEVSSSSVISLEGKGNDYNGYLGFAVTPAGASAISVTSRSDWNLTGASMYAAFYDENDNLVADDIIVNQHEASKISRYNGVASIAGNNQNEFIVNWYYSDTRDITSRAYSRIFTASGTPKTSDILLANLGIGKDGNNYVYSAPAVLALPNNYLVVFEKFDAQSKRHLVGQYVGFDGSLSGENFKMETNESTLNGTKFSRNPALALNNSGIALLGFIDARNNTGNPVHQVHFVNAWQLSTDSSGVYTSAIFDLKQPATIAKLSWNKATTSGQIVRISVRAGNDPELADAEWTDDIGTENQTEINLGLLKKQYVQYRAAMEAVSSGAQLKDVTIVYNGIATADWSIVAEPEKPLVRNSVPAAMLQTMSNNLRANLSQNTKTETSNNAKSQNENANNSSASRPVSNNSMAGKGQAAPNPNTSVAKTNEVALITQYLIQGQKNSQVKALQADLVKLGLLKAKDATGYFGQITKAALIKFQKANKIQATGTVGPATRKALNKIK